MARRKTYPTAKVAAHLVGGAPLDFAKRADGTLVVIGPAGRKLVFTAEDVRKAAGQMRAEEEQ